jgi:hypothetical protein
LTGTETLPIVQAGTTVKATVAAVAATVDLSGKAATGDIASSGLTTATNKILGRTTAATGAIEELSPTHRHGDAQCHRW